MLQNSSVFTYPKHPLFFVQMEQWLIVYIQAYSQAFALSFLLDQKVEKASLK